MYVYFSQDNVRPEVRRILEERLKALNNMGAAQLKIEAYEVALRSFESVLKCQPNNVKALFRKGKVSHLGRYPIFIYFFFFLSI